MTHPLRGRLLFLCGWIGILCPGLVQADEASIQVVPVRAGVFMLMGQGGNIGLSLGEDAPFIVDDQYAPMSEKIKAALAALPQAKEGRSSEVRFVVNTHWHGDHTGGNENFGASGAVIVAQENVRTQMSKDQFLARTPLLRPILLHPIH